MRFLLVGCRRDGGATKAGFGMMVIEIGRNKVKIFNADRLKAEVVLRAIYAAPTDWAWK